MVYHVYKPHDAESGTSSILADLDVSLYTTSSLESSQSEVRLQAKAKLVNKVVVSLNLHFVSGCLSSRVRL